MTKRWRKTVERSGMKQYHKGPRPKTIQGRMWIKDLGGTLPLYPRHERTLSWTYRKTIDNVKIAKQKAGSCAAPWKKP
jgi:hypothetical protein